GTIIQDYATHERIHSSPLGTEIYSFAAEIVKKIPEIDYVDFQFDESNATFKREDIPVDIGVEFAHESPYKVLFIVGDVHSDGVFDRISRMVQNRYSISRGWINGIEIQKLGEDKGNALRILKKQLSGKVHTTIGVGDYENDIPMLLEADISFAVDNAMPAVKAVADHSTASSETSSIASIIDRLERNQL
ncbi:MAG: HAD hydrolase family protein, partial [Saccharofermentanales bacterium]